MFFTYSLATSFPVEMLVPYVRTAYEVDEEKAALKIVNDLRTPIHLEKKRLFSF